MKLSELVGPQGQLVGALGEGLSALDESAQVTFQAYTRVVLPLDGYVFWSPTTTLIAEGSLHYAQEILQLEEETYGSGTVLFTTQQPVTEFSKMPINTVYVAGINGFRYAFSQQQGYYEQAGLWHYFGHIIPPAMASQLLDNPNFSIDQTQPVVSNSLPLWLALNGYNPTTINPNNPTAAFPDWFANTVTLYPSDLVLPNLIPPYGVVHIGPEDTRALQSAPYIDQNRNHWQLAADRVRITLYGLQNNAALDFLDMVEQYTVYTENFGIMNMPLLRDGKRTLPELQTLGMQKFIDFEISYYQVRAAEVARTLIQSALPILYVFEEELNPDIVVDQNGIPVTDQDGYVVTGSST